VPVPRSATEAGRTVLIREAFGIRKWRNLTEDGRAQSEAARILFIRPQTAED
jgi:hypothetical protein